MRAAVIEAVRRVVVREVDPPPLARGDILLQVKACAVCGTDVRIFSYGHDKVRFPWTTGHEISGVVAEVCGAAGEVSKAQGGTPGSAPAGGGPLKVGDRVNVDCTEGCGRCRLCREGRPSLCPDARVIGYHYPGGFAEYVRIPAGIVNSGGVYPLSPKVGFTEAAIIEPIAAAINGQEQVGVALGETVVIIGAGPLGYIHALLARMQGAARIIMVDVAERRLRHGDDFGVDATVDTSRLDPVATVLDLTDRAGADVVIVACSAPQACLDAVRMIGRRGRVLFFAGLPRGLSSLSVDINLVHYSEAALFGCFGASRRAYDTAHRLVDSGAFPAARLVTHTFPLDAIEQAFTAAESGEGLRVVVTP